MNIQINGEQITLAENTRLADALKSYGAKPPFAVAINGCFIPRTEHQQQTLQPGDSIELLSPIQGG